MKLPSASLGLVCASIASSLFAQNSFVPSPSVSLYQLSHKPSSRARRFFDKANAQLKLRHYQASAALLEKALKVDPLYWGAVNNLGFTYLKMEYHKQAQQAFEKAIDIDPENSIGYINLSVAALNQQEYRMAENAARTALRLNPDLPEAKALLSLSQVGQGIWTPEGRRLLQESHQAVPGSEKLLAEWPAANRRAPSVSIGVSP